jgi:hypothetical protein
MNKRVYNQHDSDHDLCRLLRLGTRVVYWRPTQSSMYSKHACNHPIRYYDTLKSISHFVGLRSSGIHPFRFYPAFQIIFYILLQTLIGRWKRWRRPKVWLREPMRYQPIPGSWIYLNLILSGFFCSQSISLKKIDQFGIS